MVKTALLTIMLAGAALADITDTIALVQERDARMVRMEHREVKQAQPYVAPTEGEIAAAQMAEAAKIIIPANLKVSRRFIKAVTKK